VESLFREFAARLGQRCGLIPLVFISIKPSPSRVGFLHNVKKTNELVLAALKSWPNTRFVDVFPLMLDPNGQARRELFTEDLLHLSRAGYLLWRDQVRACLGELRLLQ
jgi:lysophospholipase L1-like esterase